MANGDHTPRLATRCTTGNKNCGGRCIPQSQNCDVNNGAKRQLEHNNLGDVNNTHQALTNLFVTKKLTGQ